MHPSESESLAPILEALRRLGEGDLSARVSAGSASGYPEIAQAINNFAQKTYDRFQNTFSGSYALEVLNIGVWVFDIETSTPQWDATMRRLFGLSVDSNQNLLEAWRNALEPEAREIAWAGLQKAIHEGTEFSATYEITRPFTGERRLVFARGRVMKDSSGKAKTVHGIAYDRTDELVRQRELESMQKKLEKALTSAQKSERRFRNLFLNSPVGVSLVDGDGMFLAANPAYCQMLGYTETELKNLGGSAIVDPEMRPFFKEMLGELTRTEGIIPLQEIKLQHKSGRLVPTRITSRTTIDDNGVPMITSLVEDISKLRTQDIENAQLRHEKDEIFRAARFSIVTTDLNGVITGFSAEAERLTGYKASDVVGTASPPFMHDPEEILAATQELSREYGISIEPGFETFVCKPRRGFHDERVWHVTNSRGEKFPVLLTVTGLRDSEGKLFGFMAVGKDISEEVNARKEAESERLKSAHSSKLAALGEMAGGIAHEVNNPLAIIQMAANQLSELSERSPIDSERVKKHAATIERTTERIATIVKGLRNFSREGSSDPFVDTNVLGLVSETVSFCAERLRHRGVSLKVEPIDPALAVRGREVQISQVLLNLLNNASDAILDHSEKWISIAAQTKGDHVEISVTDAGDGVPEHLRKRIFEPFFTTKDVGKGTGMGLSISIGIMKNQGGDLFLDSSSSHTRFVMRFPKMK
jgi:PAS domain S-box-containing protein